MRGASGSGAAASDVSPIAIESAELLDGNEVRSGESVRFRITGDARQEIARHVEPIGIIVRSAQSGEIVFATGTSVFELEFRVGAFSIDVELQMNVQPGIYLADIGVWDRADEKQLLAGPSLNVKVMESRLFLGATNFNARMELHQPAAIVGRASA